MYLHIIELKNNLHVNIFFARILKVFRRYTDVESLQHLWKETDERK